MAAGAGAQGAPASAAEATAAAAEPCTVPRASPGNMCQRHHQVGAAGGAAEGEPQGAGGAGNAASDGEDVGAGVAAPSRIPCDCQQRTGHCAGVSLVGQHFGHHQFEALDFDQPWFFRHPIRALSSYKACSQTEVTTRHVWHWAVGCNQGARGYTGPATVTTACADTVPTAVGAPAAAETAGALAPDEAVVALIAAGAVVALNSRSTNAWMRRRLASCDSIVLCSWLTVSRSSTRCSLIFACSLECRTLSIAAVAGASSQSPITWPVAVIARAQGWW